jgi:hypothetical protein
LLQHRLQHFRVAVAEQHRAGADQVVDILAPVLVPDAGALALADDDAGIEIAESAAGQHLGGRGRSSRLGLDAFMISLIQNRRPARRERGVDGDAQAGPDGGAMRPVARTGASGVQLAARHSRQVADVEQRAGAVAAPRCSAAAVAMSDPQVSSMHIFAPRCRQRSRARRSADSPPNFDSLSATASMQPSRCLEQRSVSWASSSSFIGRPVAALDRSAILQRRAGLFQHDVEMGHGPADADRVEPVAPQFQSP